MCIHIFSSAKCKRHLFRIFKTIFFTTVWWWAFPLQWCLTSSSFYSNCILHSILLGRTILFYQKDYCCCCVWCRQMSSQLPFFSFFASTTTHRGRCGVIIKVLRTTERHCYIPHWQNGCLKALRVGKVLNFQMEFISK